VFSACHATRSARPEAEGARKLSPGIYPAPFATNREQFHKLDSWIRMRLRTMKFKRKNTLDNYKLRIRTFQQTYRLLDPESFYVATHCVGPPIPLTGLFQSESPGD
jgi:hypothetical protein